MSDFLQTKTILISVLSLTWWIYLNDSTASFYFPETSFRTSLRWYEGIKSMWIQWPFKNKKQQQLAPKVIDPWMTFDPKVTCVTLPMDHCVQFPWEYINVCGYSDKFFKIPHTYYILHTVHTHMYIKNEWSLRFVFSKAE